MFGLELRFSVTLDVETLQRLTRESECKQTYTNTAVTNAKSKRPMTNSEERKLIEHETTTGTNQGQHARTSQIKPTQFKLRHALLVS